MVIFLIYQDYRDPPMRFRAIWSLHWRCQRLESGCEESLLAIHSWGVARRPGRAQEAR